MKSKYILLGLFALSLCHSSEAQFLKKLKKKAEEAAKKTIIRKVEEKSTEKTERAMDTILNADKKIKRKNKLKNNEIEKEEKEKKNINYLNDTIDTTNSSRSPNANPLMRSGKNTAKNLSGTYRFNWEFKTKITTSKEEQVDINYLINSNTLDYFGMEMSNESLKDQGKAFMVMDNKNKSTVLFMEMEGQNMAQIHKIPDAKKSDGNSNVSYKEIGTKEILGYTCYGIEIEDKSHIGTIYFTLDAPISFSAFFAMANNKNAPKGFDPALLQVLKEDALLMEMSMSHKTKKNESFTMTPISLDKKEFEIQKKDYQFINMGF
ncbi:DUF4412 domain-containing protein [Aestuariivivens insulae]|uniref:DUF4412 domain-containing protein n=1 Tax=Aestuariivivens insulae TaxID=1621988 RepID=UPI001F569C5A|nr:DUF4412 domain-containing protein [Aestuariivivens insulae]